ncbi:MAG TPA: pitrilysin family protein [Caldimonas sp.]|jgi:zinc protease|nr:pitrilysin family protein [Caldimonas sp.]HEX2539506.1 pitrilysin family protein [Caldimonas sp.]
MKHIELARRRARSAAVLALAACIASAALAQAGSTAPRRAPPAAVSALNVPPVAYRERRLANGLQVLSIEDRSSPTVSVQVWYHVGGRNDPPGRSGFAHLFEHMMFKGTVHMKAEQFDRLTEDVGGSNNAFTSDDVTAYHSVVPSNHLETLLWAEAERMMNLKVDEASFRSERAVVQEEYRQRVLASPYGLFFHAVTTEPYLQHPYKRSAIGSIEDLEAATLADVVAFHARYYRPDNATLIVAGDFEARQLDAWVDKYFGSIKRPAEPLPAFVGSEPPWTADRTKTITAPTVPLPAIAHVWQAPPLESPDAAALLVAAAVLSSGESSRLHQSLVYRQRIATQAGFEANLRAGPGLLIAYAIASGEKPIATIGAELLAEMRRIADSPPTPAELEKVKNQLITGAFSSRQTAFGLASAMGEAAVLEGDPARINTAIEELQRVSAADVRRVVRRYVLQAAKVTLDYRQAGAGR